MAYKVTYRTHVFPGLAGPTPATPEPEIVEADEVGDDDKWLKFRKGTIGLVPFTLVRLIASDLVASVEYVPD